MLKRRQALMAGIGGVALLAGLRWHLPSAAAADETFKVVLTDAEWRARLTPSRDAVLRKAAPERPYSGLLKDKHQPGTVA